MSRARTHASRSSRRVVALALAASLAVAFGCAGGPGLGRTTGSGDAYHLVLLRSGPAELGEADLQTAMVGHFTNMERMAQAGQLLLAGPFGEPRVEADLRGLFVLDTSDPMRAAEWAGTDPAVLAGVLEAEVQALSSKTPLRRLPGLEREDAERRAETEEPWSGRPYVLAIDRSGATALAEHPAALATGRMGGAVLAFLDAEDPAAARAALEGQGVAADGIELHPWYGTRMLEEL